jgi:predicted HicB family RNase H-like nuclease
MHDERTKLVQVRVSEREHATLHELAGAEDLTVSQYVRRLVRDAADRRNESAPKARKEAKR